jgi:hypothetical protein
LGYWLAYEEPVRPPSDNIRHSVYLPQPGYQFASARDRQFAFGPGAEPTPGRLRGA